MLTEYEIITPALIPVILIAYILGAIPFAYILGRLNKLDIRRIGSGNIGATNLTRAAGRKWGVFCFCLDFGKGAAAVIVGKIISPEEASSALAVVAALAAVCGHVWPVFLGFKGGKGVAVTLGALLILTPLSTLVAAAIWLIVFRISRYVSLASICAAVTLPLSSIIITERQAGEGNDYYRIILVGALAIFIIWRHRENITRLRQGTESRFKRK